MELQTVICETRNSVAIITLNRPQCLNALNAQLGSDLAAALRSAAADSLVRVVVLTGAGRGFCSGGDLKVMAAGLSRSEASAPEIEGILRNFHDVVQYLQQIDKPVIAAIHGPAVGAGMSIALSCDFRIASEDAIFGQAFVRIGLSPDGGSTWLLPRLIGRARALQLMMTGETLGARQAMEWGLLHQLASEGEHLPRSIEFAKQLAALSPHALGSIKRLARSSERNTFAGQLGEEAREQSLNATTAEFRAAVEAFLKRK